jgi:hypothetical protein
MPNKKRRIRRMRKEGQHRQNPDGTVSTHKMAWAGDPSKKRGRFAVFPTISPKKGKETSHKSEDWEEQDYDKAKAKGETVEVKSRRKAKKLAAGSWKKGKDKTEAMRKYRRNKTRA